MADRVLVAEKIAESGVQHLSGVADVDVALDLERGELLRRISGYDALVVRSATKVDAELIAAAERLRVVGRAGTGVDNVDVDAATARGILVCNAPQSNMLSAAEHAVALMLALARRIPEAHAALVQGRWERNRFAGVELADKTLAILGFGRIGQLVAVRARAFGMRVLAYDPFVSDDRFRERGAERAPTIDDALQQADWVSLHLPATADTRHVIDARRLALMRPGVRIVNAARGDLVDTEALVDALRSGHVAGAALDVFEEEPLTASPLFELPNVVVTPHLGASTAEAQDRAGAIIAEQVAKALGGALVENAVNTPVVHEEDRAALGPFLPLADKLGRVVAALSAAGVQVVDVTFEGQIAERDTRLLTLAVLVGVLREVDEGVNVVNAMTVAELRGIEVRESRRASSRLREPDPRRDEHGGAHLRHPDRPGQPSVDGAHAGPGGRDRARRPDAVPAQRRPAGHDRPHRHGARRRAGQHRQHEPLAQPRRRPRALRHPDRRGGAVGRRAQARGARGRGGHPPGPPGRLTAQVAAGGRRTYQPAGRDPRVDSGPRRR